MEAPKAEWQLQEAKQRFSEVVRRANEQGPQVVTRHGEEVAVILSMEDYRKGASTKPSLREFLLSGPVFEELESVLERSKEPARVIDFSAD